MSKNGKKLVSGVRELILTDETTLEDLHMVATDIVVTLEKMTARVVRKLKKGQIIRCYVEGSNKEYGVKGADVVCCYRGTYETQTYGTKLKVYDPGTGKEWGVSMDCLLEVYRKFDPSSVEGKKVADVVSKPKRRGRKPKKAESHQVDRFDETTDGWSPATVTDDYEKEVDGEEYDFDNLEEYEEYLDE